MNIVPFGKWQGTPFEKVPPMDVLWLAANAEDPEIQQAAMQEKKIRLLEKYRVLITYHAIDRFSQRYWQMYIAERNNNEGIVQFLHRLTEEAFNKRWRTKKRKEHYHYAGVKFVIGSQQRQPVLKTVY